MDHVPLSIVRITEEEQELLYYFRLLPLEIQAGIAMMISGCMPAKPEEQTGLTYAAPPRLVSSN